MTMVMVTTVTSVGVIMISLAFSLHAVAAATPHQAAPSAVAARKLDSARDGDLRFHEATFIASHNSAATLADAEGVFEPLGANQDDPMIDQLTNDGVRGLMLDIMLNVEDHPEDPLRLVHSAPFLTLDYGGVRTGLGANLIPFLEENEDAIVSFFLEVKGDVGQDSVSVRAAIMDQLQNIFSTLTVKGASLKDMTFKHDHDLWKDHEDWPTLQEIRQSGQRLFVFSDRSEFSNNEYGFMFNREVLQENGWQGIEVCEARYMWGSEKVSFPSNDYWTRLFFMNHFPGASGPVAKDDTVGVNLIGGGNNGWGSLYPRVQRCMSSNGGFRPNFIALDWVAQSEEAQEIREYLNFGGRLGTGQACIEDSHCATSSCNIALGICQCQRCPSGRAGVCLGCASGQYCQNGGVEMNTCLYKEGWLQSNPDLSQSVNGLTTSPTDAPSENNVSNQFCGDTWETTVATCNDAVQCPRGNVDCPVNQTCFANLDDCPEAPTKSPSVKPSYFPSSIPSISLLSLLTGGAANSWEGGAGTPANPGNKFCGTDFSYTRDNCQSAIPCPGGNTQCNYLGTGYTCFTIECGSDSKPPPSADGSLLEYLGLTKAPSETSPPTSPFSSATPSRSPSLRPTKAPFEFSNQNFCGGNYTDAQDNCYYRNPCPTGSPAVCGGGTCYSGIICSAPPSQSPSSSPTAKPPSPPSNESLGNATPGSQSPGNESPGTQTQDYSRVEPEIVGGFDMTTFENSRNGVTKSINESTPGKVLLSIMAAIGFVDLMA